MVKIVGGDVGRCCTNVAGPCGAHPGRKPTRADVRKWASHDVPGPVAEALARRADR